MLNCVLDIFPKLKDCKIPDVCRILKVDHLTFDTIPVGNHGSCVHAFLLVLVNSLADILFLYVGDIVTPKYRMMQRETMFSCQSIILTV